MPEIIVLPELPLGEDPNTKLDQYTKEICVSCGESGPWVKVPDKDAGEKWPDDYDPWVDQHYLDSNNKHNMFHTLTVTRTLSRLIGTDYYRDLFAKKKG